MKDLSHRLFLCFAPQDQDNVKEFISHLNLELNSSIKVNQIEGTIRKQESIYFPKIEESEIVLAFVSEAANESDHFKSCIEYANNQGKRIIPIRFGTDTLNEPLSNSGMECFDCNDGQQFGKIVEQLKSSMGIEQKDKDTYGTIIRIYTDAEARISRYGKELCVAIPGQNNTILLGKGTHKLDISRVGDSSESFSIPYEVKDNSGEQTLTINFKRRREQLAKQESDEKKKVQGKPWINVIKKYWAIFAAVLVGLLLVLIFFRPNSHLELDMKAPVVRTNEDGFISLEDCPSTHKHLTINLKEDYESIDILYDGKIIQNIRKEKSDEMPNSEATTFLDANFDGFVDILIGPAASRTYSWLIVWDNSSKQFVLVGDTFQDFYLDQSSSSIWDGGSFSWCGYGISRYRLINYQVQELEHLTIITEPKEYRFNGVRNRYTIKDKDDRELQSSKSYKELPVVWQKALNIYGRGLSDEEPNDEEVIVEFITDMFNNYRYSEEDFLRKHCTQRLLQKLRDTYPYEDGGLNYWLFENGAQDVKYEDGDDRNANRITSVTQVEDGWFIYEYYSNGFWGRNIIQASIQDGVVKMNDVQEIETEFDSDF